MRTKAFPSISETSVTIQRVPLSEQIPSQVQPISFSLSFDIPGGRQLTRNWNDLSTTDSTTVTLTLSASGIRVRFYPALRIDVQWPVSDIAWNGLDYQFATGTITSIDLTSYQDLAVTAGQGDARNQIRSFWNRLLAGTRAATAGYNPLTDPNPRETLNAIQTNWTSEPSDSDVRPADVRNITPSASAHIRNRIEAGSPSGPEGGIVIEPGAVTVSATLSGNLDEVLAASQPRVSAITIESQSIFLRRSGENVARLQTVYVNYGGSVVVGRFEPLGGLRTATALEGGANFLALLMMLSAGTPADRPLLEGREAHIEPTLIPRMAREEIEAALTRAIRSFLASHPFILPGVDIGEVLGVRAPGDFPVLPSSSRSG